MNINELITKAHGIAKSKGFWDKERNTGELLMLIVSECGEALEAHRSGKRANDADVNEAEWMASVKRGPEGTIFSVNNTLFKEGFEKHIKDTFEDELADIVIRIMDLMGARGYAFNDKYDLAMKSDIKNVGENLHQVVRKLGSDDQYALDAALMGTFWMANAHGIDLWRHIELKMAYNETRSFRHGKLY